MQSLWKRKSSEWRKFPPPSVPPIPSLPRDSVQLDNRSEGNQYAGKVSSVGMASLRQAHIGWPAGPIVAKQTTSNSQSRNCQIRISEGSKSILPKAISLSLDTVGFDLPSSFQLSGSFRICGRSLRYWKTMPESEYRFNDLFDTDNISFIVNYLLLF
ncbi:hypothetical protein M9H77_05855 [Catharanthus roseus]|uniref:Uncharacterized protein n=1 Tax=Catharanthus roseus TaxID=4058 RepID=A0ACC0BQG8_CATRO|nr:hypothetical protein M9H77_05855 [Catharanthus roseus]